MNATALIEIALVYLAFHAGHSHAIYRHESKRNRFMRVWISIPGPWGSRISKRI